jgi:hypothetical protein
LLGLVLLVGLAAGVWSSAVAISAEDGSPTRPSVHTITALHQGLRVYWYEPGEDGGSAITAYDVEYRSLGAEQWTNAGHTGLSQPAVIAGLRFDTAYEVRVRARNANGAGPWSSVESARTLPNDGKPDRPWPPALEPGDGQLEVSWTAPAYTGERSITGYRVRYTTDNAATWRTWAPGGNPLITRTSTTITGLDGGIAVGVVVTAVNARGQGRYSSPTAEATPMPAASAPSAPTLRVMPMNRTLYVSWSPVSAKPPVGAYELEYQWIDWNESDWRAGWTKVGASLGPDAVGYQHRNLSPDRRYRYRLRASNSAGPGDWSAVVPQAGVQPRPDKPRLAAQTAASGSVKLSWSGGPASATHWEYRWLREDGVWGHWTQIAGSNAETTEHVVSGLTEDVHYQFLLRVSNASGIGLASTTASAVAGLTPTVASERETLFYDNFDSAGGATEDGSYALLTDADNLTSGATTFAQVSSATALLLNSGGYRGRDHTSVLKTIRTGDQITWFPGTSSCWYHFRVTAASDVPSAPSRTLLRITLETEDRCGSAAQQSDPNYLDGFRRNVAWFGWDDPPSKPVIGPDGIRVMPYRYAVEGGHTYRLVGRAGPTRIVIDVPTGMRLTEVGSLLQGNGGMITAYADEESAGAFFWLNPSTGLRANYHVPTPVGANGPPSEVVARFADLIDSVREQALP